MLTCVVQKFKFFMYKLVETATSKQNSRICFIVLQLSLRDEPVVSYSGAKRPEIFFFFLHEKSVVQGPVVQSGIKLIHNSITVTVYQSGLLSCATFWLQLLIF